MSKHFFTAPYKLPRSGHYNPRARDPSNLRTFGAELRQTSDPFPEKMTPLSSVACGDTLFQSKGAINLRRKPPPLPLNPLTPLNLLNPLNL